MFPQRVFPQRVFPARVFPKTGSEAAEVTPIGVAFNARVTFGATEDREFNSAFATRYFNSAVEER